MATSKAAISEWRTTIIASASFQNLEINQMLSAQQHRIRFSDNMESGVFIFPLSGTAFLLIEPQDVSEPFEQSGVTAKIKAFVQLHRNSFLLLYTPCFRKRELEILTEIQHSFFGRNLKVLPVRNNAEIVKGMLTIAKATSKPHVDSIRHRIAQARAHIIENSPVWEMLRGKLLSSAGDAVFIKIPAVFFFYKTKVNLVLQ